MIQTALTSIVCIVFNKNKIRNISYIQSSIGTGEVVGPFIGSLLFGIYGFQKQFFVLNLVAIIMILILVYIPNFKQKDAPNNSVQSIVIHKNMLRNLFFTKTIFFDFLVMSINISLDWCYIVYFSIELSK